MFLRKGFMILTIVFSLFIYGCSNDAVNETNSSNEDQIEQQEELTVNIKITREENDVISENEVTFTAGEVLLDVLKENFEIETDESDTFIVSIDGLSSEDEENEDMAWLYTVNEEMPSVGAHEYELEDGDVVHFDFQPVW